MKLVLFDIDGTLVSTGGAGSRSMTRAFAGLFGIENAFQNVKMAGNTDPLIFEEAARFHGIPYSEADLEQFRSLYYSLLEKEIELPNPVKKVMPGMEPLLKRLSQEPDIVQGLLTGNWRQGAILKLEHFGLWSFFRLGAFSDDHKVRKELVPVARKKWEQMHGRSLAWEDIWVIGDTPLDIACAKDNGAMAVAVATGSYSVEQLESHGPHFCFRDLGDFADLLKTITTT